LKHLAENKQLYLVIFSWALVGLTLPTLAAIIWSVFSFLFLMRSGDQTRILLAFIAMLIMSDSRSRIFLFASDAKIVVSILLWVNIIRNYSEYKNIDNKMFRYFIPFILYVSISIFWSFDIAASFQRTISFAIIYFSIPLLYINALKQNPKFNVDLVWFVVVVLGIGLVIHSVSPGFTTITGRFRGLLGNPNGMGLFLLLVFLLGFLTYKRHKEEYDLGKLAVVFLVVFGLSLVLTGSRSAIFSILIFLLFYRLSSVANFISVLAFLAFVLSYEYLFMRLPEVILYLGLEEYMRLQTLQEGSGRNVAWSFAWKNIEDVFYTGGGVGYTEYLFRLHGAELSRLGHQGNAHSSYLTIWLDTGIVGLVLFVFGLFMNILNAVSNSKFALPIVFAILFTTYFESWLAGTLSPYITLFLLLFTTLQQESGIVEGSEEHIPQTEESIVTD